jgi:peptidylprolyl isomerase
LSRSFARRESSGEILEEGPVRKTPALLSAVAVAAVLTASLVGCSASASSACTPSYSAGDASKIVKATAKTASFPTPLVTKTSQVSQNKAGTGTPIQPGDQVDYTFNIYDGKTGQTVGSSGSTQRAGAAPTVGATAITRSLACATTGERYTLVTTVKQGFGAGAGSSAGLADSNTLVVVVDIKDHFLGKANGVNLLPQDGMPDVITAVSGQPGIVIQELTKPTTLRIATIKQGSGAVVKKGATVHIKYAGFTWPATSSDSPTVWPGGQSSDGTAIPDGESTWTKDQAADIPVTSSGLPVGLYKALLGAKVGSQVLAVIPPKDGFGSSSSTYGFSDKDTIIMVIDVLGIG